MAKYCIKNCLAFLEIRNDHGSIKLDTDDNNDIKVITTYNRETKSYKPLYIENDIQPLILQSFINIAIDNIQRIGEKSKENILSLVQNNDYSGINKLDINKFLIDVNKIIQNIRSRQRNILFLNFKNNKIYNYLKLNIKLEIDKKKFEFAEQKLYLMMIPYLRNDNIENKIYKLLDQRFNNYIII